MKLDEIEQRIYDHYRFFAVAAPGVPVQESGELEILWAMFDREMEREEG